MLECDICLSELVMKEDGSGAVCSTCGVVYTVERLRRKLASASTPVVYPNTLAQKPEEVCDPNFEIRDNCLVYYFGMKTDVVIPDGVEAIGPKAFAEKNFIETVVIPDSVTRIHESAFEACGGLHTVHMGSGVRRIGKKAFYSCYHLQNVHITDLAAWCQIQHGDGKSLYPEATVSSPLINCGRLYLNGQEVTDLVLPEGITLGKTAFVGCASITSLTIPANIQFEGPCNQAFGYCSNLRSVRVLGNTALPEQCFALFEACNNLQTIHFEGPVSQVGAPKGCRVTSVVEQAKAEKLRASRRAAGVCQHCGGKFSFFGQTCTSCKTKKDY